MLHQCRGFLVAFAILAAGPWRPLLTGTEALRLDSVERFQRARTRRLRRQPVPAPSPASAPAPAPAFTVQGPAPASTTQAPCTTPLPCATTTIGFVVMMATTLQPLPWPFGGTTTLAPEVTPKKPCEQREEPEKPVVSAPAPPPPVPAVAVLPLAASSVCAAQSTCSSCTALSECGWCALEQKCVDGTKLGPQNVQCMVYDFSSCPNIPCDARSTCSDCLMDTRCGWCASSATCIKGNSLGPHFANQCSATKMTAVEERGVWLHAQGSLQCSSAPPLHTSKLWDSLRGMIYKSQARVARMQAQLKAKEEAAEAEADESPREPCPRSGSLASTTPLVSTTLPWDLLFPTTLIPLVITTTTSTTTTTTTTTTTPLLTTTFFVTPCPTSPPRLPKQPPVKVDIDINQDINRNTVQGASDQGQTAPLATSPDAAGSAAGPAGATAFSPAPAAPALLPSAIAPTEAPFTGIPLGTSS
mmetsp:Transcript_139254/g.242367  ORF Transcript_139254/g.242367 Transcript_139254/m.242367 type:complete len:472 (+) Transcript_139254:86-1501(+)